MTSKTRGLSHDGPNQAGRQAPAHRRWASLAVVACLAAAVLAPAGAATSVGPPDAHTSTVVASPASVPADGVTNSTITVTLRDAAGDPVPGRVVNLSQTSGAPVTFGTSSPVSNVSDLDGVATYVARTAAAGSATFRAVDSLDDVTITQTATVQFTVPVGVHSGAVTIDAVTPDHGPTLGRRIAITGPGVGTATSVTFGDVSVPIVAPNVVSATRIDVATPEVADAGTVDLRVVNDDGAYLPVDYTFVAPTAGRWATTSSLHHDMPRVQGGYSHLLATILQNGTILVVGTSLSSTGPPQVWVEVYDPVVESWSTCAVGDARAGCPAPLPDHFAPTTANALGDGRVLVVGQLSTGSGDRQAHAAAYLYHPDTGNWSDGGRPSLTGTATLLSGPGCAPSCGKVLVAGGAGELQDQVDCPVPETAAPLPPTCAAELFDPATETWAPTGSMAHRRRSHTASPIAGSGVLVTGGLDTAQGSGLDTAEIYHPATGAWSPARSLNLGRSAHGSLALSGGSVLVLGGYITGDPTDTAEFYDEVNNAWRYVSSLNRARASSSLVLTDGRAMVVGGGPYPFQRDRPDNTAEIYDTTAVDPATGKTGAWNYVVPMLDKLRFPVAVALADGRVLVVGTKGDTAEVGAEIFTPGPVLTSPAARPRPQGWGNSGDAFGH